MGWARPISTGAGLKFRWYIQSVPDCGIPATAAFSRQIKPPLANAA